jgi:DNA end-binding protein Ku
MRHATASADGPWNGLFPGGGHYILGHFLARFWLLSSSVMRTIWKGHLSFGLISVPVGLYAALEASERVSFRLLHRKDLSPIEYKKYCAREDVEVSNDEIVKGYEVEKNKFAVVEKEELEKMQEEAGGGSDDHTIEVLEFVELASINPLSFEKPYYLAPEKGGDKPYAVLRDALLEERKVGIVRMTIRTRPQLGVLIPSSNALAVEVIRPFEELRDTAELKLPESAKKSAEIKMAKLLIDQLTTEWDPQEHPDEYRETLTKLLSSKRKHTVAISRADTNVVDLMDALKKSVARTKSKPKKAAKAGAA